MYHTPCFIIPSASSRQCAASRMFLGILGGRTNIYNLSFFNLSYPELLFPMVLRFRYLRNYPCFCQGLDAGLIEYGPLLEISQGATGPALIHFTFLLVAHCRFYTHFRTFGGPFLTLQKKNWTIHLGYRASSGNTPARQLPKSGHASRLVYFSLH